MKSGKDEELPVRHCCRRFQARISLTFRGKKEILFFHFHDYWTKRGWRQRNFTVHVFSRFFSDGSKWFENALPKRYWGTWTRWNGRKLKGRLKKCSNLLKTVMKKWILQTVIDFTCCVGNLFEKKNPTWCAIHTFPPLSEFSSLLIFLTWKR